MLGKGKGKKWGFGGKGIIRKREGMVTGSAVMGKWEK